MINLKTMTQAYYFEDGERKIYTKNPTQDTYQAFINAKDDPGIDKVGFMTDLFDGMLYDKDAEYKDIDSATKMIIVADYMQFHLKQLSSKFPRTSDSSK